MTINSDYEVIESKNSPLISRKRIYKLAFKTPVIFVIFSHYFIFNSNLKCISIMLKQNFFSMDLNTTCCGTVRNVDYN